MDSIFRVYNSNYVDYYNKLDRNRQEAAYLKEGYYFPLDCGCPELQERYNGLLDRLIYFVTNKSARWDYYYYDLTNKPGWKNRLFEKTLRFDPELENPLNLAIAEDCVPGFDLNKWRLEHWGENWRLGWLNEILKLDPDLVYEKHQNVVRKYLFKDLLPQAFNGMNFVDILNKVFK